MIDLITRSAENFCVHQLALAYVVSDERPKLRTVIASIDIRDDDTSSHRIYIAYSDGMLKLITDLFLGEEVEDEETLVDMALETVNLIVGSAKILAAEQEIHFQIATPALEKHEIADVHYEESRLIRIDDEEMMIAIKEL